MSRRKFNLKIKSKIIIDKRRRSPYDYREKRKILIDRNENGEGGGKDEPE
jgi:hypothetical protein